MIALVLLLLVAGWASAARAETVRVSVDPAPKGPRVAGRFLGLSFEAAALPAMARNAGRGNLVTLLRSLGPGMLRFGGVSADTSTAYSANGEGPAWATTTLTPRDFARLGRLARRTGWRVLLTVPLGHHDAEAASREAAAAARRLGPALAAVEIGNEPNAFQLIGLRPPSYTFADYRSEIETYRRAIEAAVPAVRIAGPDTVPQLGGVLWLYEYARVERPALLTPHYYALNACTQPGLTLADLLGTSVATTEAQTISGFAAIARLHGLPLRLGETNNVACAGMPGVSDTFGAALWALRYMITLVRSGIAGVNFHVLPESCNGYTPLCARTTADYRRGRLHAMPEWYALLLFRQVVGHRIAGVSLSSQPPGLSVEAFQGASMNELALVAVNTSADSEASLAIRLAGHDELRSGTVLALTAPALDTKVGTRLAGARVNREGTWRPDRRLPRIPTHAGTLRAVVPSGTAALIRLTREPHPP